MLCALLVSALATQTAGAAGTTAYTCASGSGSFSDAHCKTFVGGGGSFVHKSIANNTTTELTGSNETTGGVKDSTKLKFTLAGIAMTITATDNTISGWMTNAEEGGEMYAHGEGTATKTGVTSTGPCTVKTHSPDAGEVGVVHTEPIKGSTKGQGDAVKFEPTEGNVLARFTLDDCPNPLINGTYTVTGSIKSTSIEGATVNFTHADTTTQNTLRINGTIKAGIEGTVTFKTRNNSTEAYTALSATT
jgi:hypothetical protein